MKRNTKELIRLIDSIPDNNATPEDVRILKSGYKNLCPVLRKVDSYFCYYLVICFFMLYATFDECTCSGVSKFNAQCGRLLL